MNECTIELLCEKMNAIRLTFKNNCLPKSLINRFRITFIMPKTRRSSYNMALKLEVFVEAEAFENNSEIAREYGLSESMVLAGAKMKPNFSTAN